nr:hypothetical protein [Tanacetum cinerariifolium]
SEPSASTVGSAKHQLDLESAGPLGTLTLQPRTGTALEHFRACYSTVGGFRFVASDHCSYLRRNPDPVVGSGHHN